MSTQPGRTGARTRSAEPAFDTAIGDLALPRHPTTTTISTAAPAAPPPAYGGPGLPLSRTVSSGRTLTNPRRSAIVKLAWASHPALGGSWLAAPVRLIRYLRMEGEVVSSQFPDEFTEVLDASAGVTEDDIRKAEQLFEARVNHLNKWIIADALALTRFWMAFLLVVDAGIIAFFIASLVVTHAQQTAMLQASEVTLIVMILLTGGLINHIRIRRWQLHAMLRGLSQQWSPTSALSSRAPILQQAGGGALLRAYIAANGNWANVESNLSTPAQDDMSKVNMRWTMVQHEGSIGPSWRPIIHVEMIVPAMLAPAPIPASTEGPQEDYVPKYRPRRARGETIVQFSP